MHVLFVKGLCDCLAFCSYVNFCSQLPQLGSYFLPERNKSAKQKTGIAKKTTEPKWNHTFIYEDLSLSDLKARCLELTVWDYDKLASNEFLGGIRLSLGAGKPNIFL